MSIEYTNISCRLKGYGVLITATGPDDIEKEVLIDGHDIKAQFGVIPSVWIAENEDCEQELWSLFHAVNGIEMQEV